jgi:hypothetical protein
MSERYQRIRERAYLIWVDEGYPQGRDFVHWLMAEQEFGEVSVVEVVAVTTVDVPRGPERPVATDAPGAGAAAHRGPGSGSRTVGPDATIARHEPAGGQEATGTAAQGPEQAPEKTAAPAKTAAKTTSKKASKTASTKEPADSAKKKASGAGRKAAAPAPAPRKAASRKT